MKRKYDIGGGVTITDDGHVIGLEHKRADGSGAYMGIRRPPLGPLPDELDIQYSEGGRYFYLPGFTDMHGFWLSVPLWKSRQEMESQQSAGVLGKQGASFVHSSGETCYRELLYFPYWSVKAEKGTKKITRVDEMAQDYLALAQKDDREKESRFNEAIAHTGRTLKWVMERVGPWVPIPPHPPPVVLTEESPRLA